MKKLSLLCACVGQKVIISIRYRGAESCLSKTCRSPGAVDSPVVSVVAYSRLHPPGGQVASHQEGPDHRVIVESRGTISSYSETYFAPFTFMTVGLLPGGSSLSR